MKPSPLRLFSFVLCSLTLLMGGCRFPGRSPTPLPTPTPPSLPLPTVTATPRAPERTAFHTFAHGELLPDMRIPLRRSAKGEGGWYVVIGSAEGWASFLSRMGQPAEIWEPIDWKHNIIIGALLGVRRGRGYAITITDFEIRGVSAVARVTFTIPPPEQTASDWTTYPFHLIRVPRDEWPLGPVSLRFVAAADGNGHRAGEELATVVVDVSGLDIIWAPGEQAVYPTPTPLPATSTPAPTPTPTPVPNLQVMGTVLEVMPDTLRIRMIPADGDQEFIDLLEATSILLPDGQPASLAHLIPGTVIRVLGYTGAGDEIRAAHIDVLRLPEQKRIFATYRPRTVSLATLYDGYRLPLSVTAISTTFPITAAFDLTQTNVLTRNGFFVRPAAYTSFIDLYNDPQYITYPIFISTDSVMHLSQLVLEHVLHSVEQTHLAAELEMLDREMFKLSWAEFQGSRFSPLPERRRTAGVAGRNAAYFAVALSLLDPNFVPPSPISPVVHAELALITAGEAITISPWLSMTNALADVGTQLDYRRFVPTGYYASCDACARYYRALTWHRTVPMRTSSREEMRSAAMMAYFFRTEPAPRILWERLYATISFFQGRDASYTPAQLVEAWTQAWGDEAGITALTDDEGIETFARATASLPLPDNPIWTFWNARQPLSRDVRFLPPSFRVDAYIFPQMHAPQVGDPGHEREFPSYIDLAAVLGSLEAYRVATQVGDTNFTNYVEQVDRVRNELAALRPDHWTQDLYWNWLYTYRALLQDKTPSYPDWMRTASWRRKELQTVFGNWTHVRHDDGVPPSSPVEESRKETEKQSPPWGYVEPQPEVYARLASLSDMIARGLDERLLLSPADRKLLGDLQDLLLFLQDAARRELTGQALGAEEQRRLGSYGALLEEMIRTAMRGLDEKATAITTVAVGRDGRLVEATGGVDEIFIIVERGRKSYLTRGGVYSHYEFVWTADEPLDDDRWRKLLASGQRPPRPAWVRSFVIPTSPRR